MSTSPRVQRMVLFKHGVAYLERSGPAEGAFELSFKKDEMNDVLKSLAVWVARGDAKVGAIAFEKPEDPERALDERRLNYNLWQTLQGLVGSARGRRVSIDAGATLEGEIIGAEAWPGGEGPEQRRVLLRTDEGTVVVVDFKEVRTLRLLEPSSRADLAFFLDRRRAATSGESRTVQVSVTGRAEELRVSYVIPAPTWRVSYRLARSAQGATFLAWGIVHNPADEDLDDLDLTLTTGQPVSFDIDLYHPRNVRRVVVEESSRALAAAPTQFERARSAPPPARPASAPMAGGPPPGAPAPQARAMMQAFADRAADASASSYEDRGELFEYHVAQKVSLKRGSSAMVPLFAAPLEAKKERIWRDGSPPQPDIVLSFKNGTGAVLEEGPTVVYDDDVYAGEAMVPYTARGAEVKLAFAKDLAVRCKKTTSHKRFGTGIRLADGFLAEEQRQELHHELTAESDHDEAVLVVFELPKTTSRAIAPEHAQPFEETSSYRRFTATVAPRSKATVTVVERWQDSQRFEYLTLTSAHLASWLEYRFLDRQTFDRLSEIIATQAEAQSFDLRRTRFEAEQAAAYAKQTKLTEQLQVLKEGGPEGQLRLRYVGELQAEQDKVNACEKEIRKLRDAAEAARQRVVEQMKAVAGGPEVRG